MTATSRWTLESYMAHNEAMRARDREELVKQAAEYERRLDALNHENARVSQAADKSVSRELFDARIVPLEAFVALSTGRGTGALDQRSLIGWIVAVIATLITIGAFVFPRQPEVVYVPATTVAPSSQK